MHNKHIQYSTMLAVFVIAIVSFSAISFAQEENTAPNWCFAGNEWGDQGCDTETEWACGYYNQLYDDGLADGIPETCYGDYIETKGIDNWCFEPGPFADGICNNQPSDADVANYWECGWWGAQLDMGNYSLQELAEANLLCLGLYIELRRPDLLITTGSVASVAGAIAPAGLCVTGFADLLYTGPGLNYFYFGSTDGSCTTGGATGDIFVVEAFDLFDARFQCDMEGYTNARSLMDEGSWNVPGAYSCYID